MTHAALHFTHEDRLELERELYYRSLHEFVKAAWHVLEPGNPYVDGWHVGAICEHLEAISDGDFNRLLINIPPGTMKSTLTSVFWPAWEWGPLGQASTRVIGASHEQTLAVRDTLKMRRLITSDWFHERWPIVLTGDQNQKTYYENDKTGFRQASAISSMTGKRGDRVIWDDPLSVQGAKSDAKREEAIELLTGTLPTRLNSPKDSAIVIVMQRLHENDPSGHILKSDLGYEHLCLPMEYEPALTKTTSIGFKDPRKEQGELLFPERFPRDVVDRDKQTMTSQHGSYFVSGQFQQNPAPLGGGMIKTKWFEYWQVLPLLKFRNIYVDTAQKEKTENDYSVLQCWGMGSDGRIYLVDQIRGKWPAPELRRRTLAFWKKHEAADKSTMGKLRRLNIEDKSSGTGLIQDLKDRKVTGGLRIPVKAIPRTIDKITRGHDAAPTIESGYVVLPADAHWLSDFLDEAEKFPRGAHDDQLDPMFDAVDDMYHNQRGRVV